MTRDSAAPGFRTLSFAIRATLLVSAIFGGSITNADDPMPKQFNSGSCKGTSYFETAIAANGGVIPTDTGDLAELIADKLQSHLKITGISVGDSRSAERAHTSVPMPRSIYAIQRSELNANRFGGTTVRVEDATPPILIGEAPDAHQLEVVSKVPGTGCYKFILVQKFQKGQRPVIAHPDRGVCTACHQAGGPIFTHFPWSETTFGSNPMADKVRQGQHDRLKDAAAKEWNKFFGSIKPPVFSADASDVEIRETAKKAAGPLAESNAFSKLVNNAIGTPEAVKKKILENWASIIPKPPEWGKSDPAFSDSIDRDVREALSNAGLFRNKDTVVKIMSAAREDVGVGGLQNPDRFNGATSKISVQLDGGFDFDGIVRRANGTLQQERICGSLCKSGDLDCKKAVLAAAILGLPTVSPRFQNGGQFTSLALTPPTSNEAMQILNGKLETAQKANWPKDNFSYPSSVIPDRDPFADADHMGSTKLFVVTDPELVAARGLSGSLSSDAARAFVKTTGVPLPHKGPLMTYEEDQATSDPSQTPGVQTLLIPGIQGPADPKTPRPRIREIPPDRIAEGIAPFAGASCLGWSLEDIRKISALRSTDAATLSVMDDSAISSILARSWPPVSADLIPAVLRRLSGSRQMAVDQIKCDDPLLQVLTGSATNSMVVTAGVAKSAVSQVPREKVLPMFSKYCSQCHTKEPYLLPLEDIAKMRSYPGQPDETFVARLQHLEMPPPNAKLPLGAGDRQLMIDLLNNKDN